MKATIEDAPTFIDTPKGDQLVVMTRQAYDRLVASQGGSTSSPPERTFQDDDIEMASRRLREWEAAGRPSVPLAVVRRVRAGESYLGAMRAYRGLTQKELANRVGVEQGHLSEVEMARSVPSDTTRERLAEALDLHPLFLSASAPMPETGR